MMSALTESPAWRALQTHRRELDALHLRDLFARDAGRGQRLSAEAAGIRLDYSRQRLTDPTLERLLDLARSRQVEAGIAAMFAGDTINPTENRAALHVALRNFGADGQPEWPLAAQGRPVMDDVAAVLARLQAFSEAVRGGRWRGYSERPIRDVVNIGIGGSDLGPRLVCEALAPPVGGGLRAHFVANVDPDELDRVLAGLKPASTLFIVTSKTFTTAETLANAHAARAWLLETFGDEQAVARHFVAVTTNLEAAAAFGIPKESCFGFWDWVGGRYSLWSAVGLSIALALGMDAFRELLAGAHAMDRHFRDTPLAQNLPVLMGLLGIWNTNFLGLPTQAVVPYGQALRHFPGWLQQLEMESNGKAVDRDGNPVDYATAPVVWGDVGTNAQHAFFQLLHQGPQPQPVDFILPLSARRDERERQRVANCLAQAEALMRGKTADEVRAELAARGLAGAELESAIPHRVFPGNRPSSLLLMPDLSPATLGALLALYEHKVYVQSLVWNICAFDQWGVELGKQLAGRVQAALGGPAGADLPALLEQLRAAG
jgi:glucose-6-phosphate isomerase